MMMVKETARGATHDKFIRITVHSNSLRSMCRRAKLIFHVLTTGELRVFLNVLCHDSV